jgi:hypothetical protein
VDPPTKVDTKPSCGRIKPHLLHAAHPCSHEQSSNKQRKAEGLPFWYGGRGGLARARIGATALRQRWCLASRQRHCASATVIRRYTIRATTYSITVVRWATPCINDCCYENRIN